MQANDSAAQPASRQIAAATANPPNPPLPVRTTANGASSKATTSTLPVSRAVERKKLDDVELDEVELELVDVEPFVPLMA
jgi:hypothetical protein